MKNCFDELDANLNVAAKVNAKAKAAAKSKALNNAYDAVATIMQTGAKQANVDMKVLMENDFDAASKKLYKYINDSINAGITAANNGKAYDFKFDSTLLKDSAVTTALSMGVRFSVGNGFFAMPNAVGHQDIADSIMEAIEESTTGTEVAGDEMSAAMDDIMAFMLKASPAMFDSQKQIINKMKKAVNNLDSYAKDQLDAYASVKTAYSGKGLDDEVKAVEKELNETIEPMMAEVYEKLLNDFKNSNKASPIFTHHIDFVNASHYEKEMAYEGTEPNQIVVDHIASMTDDYFIDLYEHLFPKSTRKIEYKGYFE
jgi:dGTP triphosphohydrolase